MLPGDCTLRREASGSDEIANITIAQDWAEVVTQRPTTAFEKATRQLLQRLRKLATSQFRHIDWPKANAWIFLEHNMPILVWRPEADILIMAARHK